MAALSPRDARLALALGGDAAPFPGTGPVAVFRPVPADRLDGVEPGRLCIYTGFKPDHDAFAARGLTVARAPEGGARHAAALVCLPRARAFAQGLIAAACAVTDGPVLVDGQKTDGVDALLRACRARMEVGEAISKAHGKLFALDGPAGATALADWRLAPQRIAGGYTTAPGVFSADGPDPGSVALASVLPAVMPGMVADLGAGWGWLAAQVLAREGVREIHLIEAEADALDCARMNLSDPRAHFHWADATAFRAPVPFDAIVCNPPFHAGRSADPALGRAFVAAAAGLLAPSGTLWLVANRHLAYEEALAAAFNRVARLDDTGGSYKLFRADQPRRQPSRGARLSPHQGRRR
mgnify:CR=1 FL=1